MYIDTHFHLSSEDYDNPQEILEKARKNGIEKFIISGCDRKGIEEALQLADQFEDVFITIGYHPEFADSVNEDDLNYLEMCLSHPKVVGVGEIGLDYHYGKENRTKQIELFQYQLQLANQYQKPVVIHTRDAIQDTYDIIKNYDNKGVIHCFSESLEMAKLFIKLGYFLGIGGVVTFKNSKLYRIVEEIPLEFIVLETDSPYLAPDPYRGEKNGPWNIPIIAEKIANTKQISLEQVAQTTTNNACRLFDLPHNL